MGKFWKFLFICLACFACFAAIRATVRSAYPLNKRKNRVYYMDFTKLA